MRLALCLVLLTLGTVGCDLVTEPDGPRPEDFEYEASSTNAAETTPISEAVSTITDARLRQRGERFAD